MERIAFLLTLVLSLAISSSQYNIIDSNNQFVYYSNGVNILVDNNDQETVFRVVKFGRTIHQVHLNEGFGKNLTHEGTSFGFILHGNNQDVIFRIIEDTADFSLLQVTSSMKIEQKDQHCMELNTGPEYLIQYWPVEKLTLINNEYTPKRHKIDKMVSTPIAERYWLHSGGGFIVIDDQVPLFIDQNVNANTICFVSKNEQPYDKRSKTNMVYYLGSSADVKLAHKEAVKHYLKKPTDVPDRLMVQHPIWSTWARYKRDINESTVELFASEIEKHGFDNSQLEIDDDWETCYGALEFRKSKFANIRKQTDNLRSRGFRVTLWVHPFINKGCEPWYTEAKEKGYLILNKEGNPDTQWWNSKENEAAHIDFTKEDATKWFSDRLRSLQKEAGIDGFKFDAGQCSYIPDDPKLNASINDHPIAITKAYIRAVSEFGPISEVRAGHGTQDLPIYTRMFDKDSEWGFNIGLPTLITTLLQMNMVGYGFVLPDMIGGNGYNGAPEEELFIRWLQANVFMPSIQYSYVPWDYSAQAIEISKKYTKLHADYTEEVMKAFGEAVKTGEPVNPPIWWLDPEDTVALGISDEFLLGNTILSAPVIEKGVTSRHIYLPKGTWSDPNLGKTYVGPKWLMDYPAAIDVLPYFIRNTDS